MCPASLKDLIEKSEIWLDGQPARIVGYREPFATVTSKSKEASYTWPAVQRIVQSGGRFRT